MKNTLITTLIGISAFLFTVTTSFAAITILKNGGLGQVTGNTDSFGVAVCNGGAQTVSQSVPVSVSANGRTMTASSAAQIESGACAYSYLPYAEFAMQAGQTYSVTVTIDPQKTLISNSDNQTSYQVTVPTGPTAFGHDANVATANVGEQSGGFFAMIFNFFSRLFGGK